jgi:membrane protease YdiL (CAAX protease family)
MNQIGSRLRGHYLEWLLWVVLLITAYVGASYILIWLLSILSLLGVSIDVRMTIPTLIVHVVLLIIMVGLFVGLPYLAHRRLVTAAEAGIARTVVWKDIGLGIAGFAAYALIATIVLTAARLAPGFNGSEAQHLGVTTLFGVDRVVGFVVLVLITPILEELLFRGILYGKLRQARMPFWPAALLVSALFGVAHGQWNVALDVFCLSMVACYLRESTGAIWAGVLLHVLKNMIAFYFTFVVIQGIAG